MIYTDQTQQRYTADITTSFLLVNGKWQRIAVISAALSEIPQDQLRMVFAGARFITEEGSGFDRVYAVDGIHSILVEGSNAFVRMRVVYSYERENLRSTVQELRETITRLEAVVESAKQ
jgi:hypothetical protein